MLAGANRTVTVQVPPAARLMPVQVSPVTVNAAAPVSVSVSAIFDVTPADLIATKAENIEVRKTGTTGDLSVADLAAIRPRRARIRPE
jgi:hypothetical protein